MTQCQLVCCRLDGPELSLSSEMLQTEGGVAGQAEMEDQNVPQF